MKTSHKGIVSQPESKQERPAKDPALGPSPLTVESSFADLLSRAVADRLEHDPSLLRIPLDNIDRWLARGVLSNPRWFLRWRELLENARSDASAFRRVLGLLRSDTEEARRWRDFSPFAGVLSSAERRKIIRQCSYSHCNAEITYRVTSNRILASGYALRITHYRGVRNSSGVWIISAA